MTLKQHHFQTPERPREEYYTKDIVKQGGSVTHHDVLDSNAFQKDTTEWESLYGEEPQPEWKEWANESEIWPIDRAFYVSKDGVNFEISVWGTIESQGYPPDSFKFFADKATFDAIHQRWKDHQIKFPGFKKHVYKSTITEFSCEVENKTIAVCFWADTGETVVSIINDQNEIIFEMSAPDVGVEEFEMALKNRNIKL